MNKQELENIANLESSDTDKVAFGKTSTIRELVTVLREFSKILALANAHDKELSNAIGRLADILSRHKDKPINDVLNSLTIGKQRQPLRPTLKTSKTISELEAKTLTLERIEQLIESGKLSKSDLIAIAVGRFAMSKADLIKTRRIHIIEAVKTAITNLRTIEIIGKQAAGDR